jgi:DNA polymerase-3 subunit epsilon
MFAVIDTETTGLFENDRIVEIAIVTLDESGAVVDEWDTLINPERDVGPVEIHGVSATMVDAAPTFEEVLWAIAKRLNDQIMVAHNLQFDERMLRSEFNRAGAHWDPGIGVCTLQATGCKLEIACRSHGIVIEQQHRALTDARAAAALFKATASRAADKPRQVAHIPELTQRSSRTVRREAFPEAPRWMEQSSAVSTWSDAIDYRRYPTDEWGYLDLLDRALDDLWLSAEERVELSELARAAGISAQRLPELHERYVADIYEAAVRDGVITDEEFRQLDAVADALGFRLGVLYPDFEKLRTPAPPEASMGPGTKLAFTGSAIDPSDGRKLERSELQALALSAGFSPQPSLTKKDTEVLVAADPNTQSGKAKKASQWGIPVISVADFIEFCQKGEER